LGSDPFLVILHPESAFRLTPPPHPHPPQIIAFLAHWVACGFEAYARHAGFDPRILVGTNPALFVQVAGLDRYVYALYWAVTTLAGNEWNVSGGVFAGHVMLWWPAGGWVDLSVQISRQPSLYPAHNQPSGQPKNNRQDTEGVEDMVQVTANMARASVFLLFNLALGEWADPLTLSPAGCNGLCNAADLCNSWPWPHKPP
jgi:hypothetical protein